MSEKQQWHLKPGEKPNSLGTYTVFFGHGETIANQICETRELEHARLISAAPELLEACKAWQKYFNQLIDDMESGDDLRAVTLQYHAKRIEATNAAISKAEGERT